MIFFDCVTDRINFDLHKIKNNNKFVHKEVNCVQTDNSVTYVKTTIKFTKQKMNVPKQTCKTRVKHNWKQVSRLSNSHF